ncbi:8846_t:CDS:2 [Ambispora gerdemannii]|uniref:8846_t:CDS:1 n=1 Tax=Ambispora gerdemannii TaxID=144530 RepID=A0A9N9FTM6_9GLOM|nr:8846_t:CDS:2 [Ambispora gerdemannii]
MTRIWPPYTPFPFAHHLDVALFPQLSQKVKNSSRRSNFISMTTRLKFSINDYSYINDNS